MKNMKRSQFIPVLGALLSPLLITESNAAEIILDNLSPTGVTIIGDWETSASTPGYYGDDYLHDNNTADDGEKSVTFTPSFENSGTYQVYIRWSAYENRATNVPVTITHAGGSTNVEINQRSTGGEWVFLGSYNFDASSTSTVTIANADDTDGYVIADAVRFVELTPSIAGTNWELTFEDNFDGTTLNGEKWRLGSHWAGMEGDGVIDPKIVTVSDGYLNITAKDIKQTVETDETANQVSFADKDSDYSSAQISTFDVFNQKYGYFEARLKSPAVKGLWPSFWMMPDRQAYGWLGGYHRSYLKFNLTSAGLDASDILSASLVVHSSEVEADDAPTFNNVLFKKLHDDAWTEDTITWNNRPIPDPVWIAQEWNTINSDMEISIDVLDYVLEEIDGDQIISFVLADTFLRTKTVKFHSSEAEDASKHPTLVINGKAYAVSDDAYVVRGNYANENYGDKAVLWVEDSWGNGTSTKSYTITDSYGDTSTTQGMEFDVMESLGIWGDDVTAHAVHWNDYSADHKSKSWPDITYPASEDGFHTYGAYWQEGILEFYIDGKKTGEAAVTDVVGDTASYLMLSLQLGGWDNNTVSELVHNQTMQVDWVRAWTGTRTAVTSTEVIVDNTDVDLVTATGEWKASTSVAGYYGTNYVHDNDEGDKAFSYQVDVESAGTYWVYGRWTSHEHRASDVPVYIDGVKVTPTVNQQEKGDMWVFLAEKTITAEDIAAVDVEGNSGTATITVTIDNENTDGIVIADAVRALRVAN